MNNADNVVTLNLHQIELYLIIAIIVTWPILISFNLFIVCLYVLLLAAYCTCSDKPVYSENKRILELKFILH